MEHPDIPVDQSLTDDTETNILHHFLEHGLHCAQKGHFAEATAFFIRARAQPGYRALATSDAALVEAFLCSQVAYQQAQQNLQQASRHFVAAEQTYQECLRALDTALASRKQQFILTGLTNLSPPAQGLQQSEHAGGLSENSNHCLTLPHFPCVSEPCSQDSSLPPLFFTCFGRFEVHRDEQALALCSNRNGRAILRYLVAHPRHQETADRLMDLLWPEDEPRVANHKLQVAISALRRSLNAGYVGGAEKGYILCSERTYALNEVVPLHSDVSEFLALYQARQASRGYARLVHYEQACQLYTGPFLPEDLYADWSFAQREQYRQYYLTMCHALAEDAWSQRNYETVVRWSRAILQEDRCDERAHRQLMLAYAASGRRSEALRHYQHCQRVLQEELSIQPSAETTRMFSLISSGATLSPSGVSLQECLSGLDMLEDL